VEPHPPEAITATVAGVAPAGDADGNEGDEGEEIPAALGVEVEQPVTSRRVAVTSTRWRIPSWYTARELPVP
jgi:hypothetical protein